MIDFNYDKKILDDIKDITVELVGNDGELIKELSASVNTFNPYEFDITKYLPNSYAMTIDSFIDTARNLLKDVEERESKTNFITLTEEYPPEPFDQYGDEVITWKVISREPGKMDAKGTGRPQRKSNYAYSVHSPYEPNKIITVESRPVDHIIEFCCWGKTNKLANERAYWLEKILVNNSFVFELNGAERFFWKDRKTDTYMTVGNQRLFYRQLHFFLRFREFEAKAETILRQILVQNTITK